VKTRDSKSRELSENKIPTHALRYMRVPT